MTAIIRLEGAGLLRDRAELAAIRAPFPAHIDMAPLLLAPLFAAALVLLIGWALTPDTTIAALTAPCGDGGVTHREGTGQ